MEDKRKTRKKMKMKVGDERLRENIRKTSKYFEKL